MKVAWVTPLSTMSAIAEYSVHVSTSLAEHCEVDLWAADRRPWRPAEVPVLDGRAVATTALSDYDDVVFNFGDHVGFHRSVYEMSRAHQGIALLHDRTYDNLLRRAGDGAGTSSKQVAVGAIGLVVHADDHRRDLAREWLGPVGRVHFPVYPRHWSARSPDPSARHDRRTIVTTGYVNRNKQVHRVLELFGREQDLRKRLRYVVVGPATEAYAAELERIVERHRLAGSVELVLGYQPDEVLGRFLDGADGFVNLREPPLESAPASLLEQLPRAKPIVVSDVGYSAELPTDAVLKVPVGDDRALAHRLRQLATETPSLEALGDRARAHALSLTVDRTAREILDFLEKAREWRPLLALSRRVAEELASLHASRDATVIPQLAAQIAPLVPGEP